jgi:hypothetical protein
MLRCMSYENSKLVHLMTEDPQQGGIILPMTTKPPATTENPSHFEKSSKDSLTKKEKLRKFRKKLERKNFLLQAFFPPLSLPVLLMHSQPVLSNISQSCKRVVHASSFGKCRRRRGRRRAPDQSSSQEKSSSSSVTKGNPSLLGKDVIYRSHNIFKISCLAKNERMRLP